MAPEQIKQMKEALQKWCAILNDDGSNHTRGKAE